MTSRRLSIALGLVVVHALLGCGTSTPQPSATRKAKAVAPKTQPQPDLPEVEDPGAEAPAPPGQVEPVFRPDDSRPSHDDGQVAKAGIRRWESQRLVLYTDLPEEQARPLLAVTDEIHAAWEDWFGPLPPARDGREFQMTGYLMADQERFREVGLLPEALPPFLHGRHRGQQFWMNDQKDAYYRAHLLLHEATHCRMTLIPNRLAASTWYMEGMAERFATHFQPPGEATRFGVMPHDREVFPGLGRIRMIADDIAAGEALELSELLPLTGNDYVKRNSCYAWSWALCHFLATHPRYRERFQKIERTIPSYHPNDGFRAVFERDWRDLQDEWRLYCRNLCHGYDVERSAIDFVPGVRLPSHGVQVRIRADRGWQSTGVELKAGQRYALQAEGRFTVAREPKPWISEPQGVSIRYVDGRPLGQLVGCLRPSSPSDEATMTQVLSIGRETTLKTAKNSTLYLRINDAWNALGDNAGDVQVTIRAE